MSHAKGKWHILAIPNKSSIGHKLCWSIITLVLVISILMEILTKLKL